MHVRVHMTPTSSDVMIKTSTSDDSDVDTRFKVLDYNVSGGPADSPAEAKYSAMACTCARYIVEDIDL